MMVLLNYGIKDEVESFYEMLKWEMRTHTHTEAIIYFWLYFACRQP